MLQIDRHSYDVSHSLVSASLLLPAPSPSSPDSASVAMTLLVPSWRKFSSIANRSCVSPAYFCRLALAVDRVSCCACPWPLTQFPVVLMVKKPMKVATKRMKATKTKEIVSISTTTLQKWKHGRKVSKHLSLELFRRLFVSLLPILCRTIPLYSRCDSAILLPGGAFKLKYILELKQ